MPLFIVLRAKRGMCLKSHNRAWIVAAFRADAKSSKRILLGLRKAGVAIEVTCGFEMISRNAASV
jgi:hypothetical protein